MSTTINLGTNISDTLNTAMNEISEYSDKVWGGMVSMLERRVIGGNYAGNPYSIIWSEMRELLNTVLGLNISENPQPYEKMTGYMYRHMLINMYERSLTLSTIGIDAYTSGNPDNLGINAFTPEYAHNSDNYLDFVNGLKVDEPNGVNSTNLRVGYDPNGRMDTVSLYPDDLDRLNGEPASLVWELTNRNSILAKTKKLFNDRKINTLISRFGTGADEPDAIQYNGKVGYNDIGSSRGRNLKKVTSYPENGYNNPYCRVWTHHYQYDKLSKTIRPFEGGGNIQKLHTWNNANFKPTDEEKGEDKNKYFWKNENEGWNHSVLSQQDGMVNITPKYGIGSKTIHTKDCMFSIENLAWKDYSPIDFENTLSWEQRGPLGGRIMWFPPYGLSVTDNTNVSWNSNTFIGRGENVYTYSNTERTGNITFYMLTDHPSITDYASWSADEANDIDEDVWLRFFAGCDSLDGNDPNSLLYYVKPTPADLDITYNSGNEPEQEATAPTDPKPDEPSDSVDTVSFCVFFPNNYSGYYDNKDFAIGYLLGGENAQKQENSREDKYISFIFSNTNEFTVGYEIGNTGITDDTDTGNRIIGNEKFWNQCLGSDNYIEKPSKTWYYRIDGKYEVPKTVGSFNPNSKTESDYYANCYDQLLASPSSYQDTSSTQLNKVAGTNIPNELVSDKTNLYSFVEVAYAIASSKNYAISEYLKPLLSQDREEKIENLKSLITNKVESIEVIGYANSQGRNPDDSLTETRNKVLAKQRGLTVRNWINYELNTDATTSVSSTFNIHTVSSSDENETNAKVWRCAKCTIKFKTETTEAANKADGDYSNVSEEQVQTVAKETNTPYNTLKGILSQTGIFEEGSDFMNTYNEITEKQKEPIIKTTGLNKTRYDNEMFFYKKFAKDNPLVFKKLTQKLQYFDPGFHSMTPEGYNERLTFLHQCCRQGNTVTASDNVPNSTNDKDNSVKVTTASNMAFGRPPFCVLRLGDFYNQMIIIRDMTITFEESGGMTWDLNDEGIGVQPMLAKISLNVVFIGGGDMRGPVRRLQNAMSFNYYANASLYDNRADRVAYDATMNLSHDMGGNGNDKFETDTSKGVYFYSVPPTDNNPKNTNK